MRCDKLQVSCANFLNRLSQVIVRESRTLRICQRCDLTSLPSRYFSCLITPKQSSTRELKMRKIYIARWTS